MGTENVTWSTLPLTGDLCAANDCFTNLHAIFSILHASGDNFPMIKAFNNIESGTQALPA